MMAWAIGELWFQRADANAPGSALLLKLLFTEEPLSIQVRPDNSFAQSIGLPRSKTEAWYIVSAMPSAEIAIGLSEQLTAAQLRGSIDDGSISDLVQWNRSPEGRRHFCPGWHDPCHRGRTCDCGDPAAK